VLGARGRSVEGVGMKGVWSGRRVLVTGHTGFKGAWMALWLHRLGASVAGLSLPATDPNGAHAVLRVTVDEHLVDVRDDAAVVRAVRSIAPDVVFHLAAQALVQPSYRDPASTYSTNVLGTLNVLESVFASGSSAATVVVTSDKVYAHASSGRPCIEDDRLGGVDPYSSSKACAELVTHSFRERSGLAVSTARAGNVVGGGDGAHDRLLPDVRRAVAAGEPVRLRYPHAIRPWQFVLDPLWGYLLLAERLLERPHEIPGAVNFGPSDSGVPVSDVVDSVLGHLGRGSWEADPREHPYEAPALRLDCTLARRVLGWSTLVDLDGAIRSTVEWWRTQDSGDSVRTLAERQIEGFEDLVASARMTVDTP
jgi:CDP-glucose 4,6-dehydratase